MILSGQNMSGRLVSLFPPYIFSLSDIRILALDDRDRLDAWIGDLDTLLVFVCLLHMLHGTN